MSCCCCCSCCCCSCFQDISQYLKVVAAKKARVWGKGRDPTPKKVLHAKSGPMYDRSWQGVKTFFGVGSLNLKGSNPEEKFYTRSQDLCLTSLGKVSRLSSGLDPQIQYPGQVLAVQRTVNLLIQSNNRTRDGQSLSRTLYLQLYKSSFLIS